MAHIVDPEARKDNLGGKFWDGSGSVLDSSMGGSPGELSEELVTQDKRKNGWRMNCDVGEATEGLENEL